jgi:hypothetical protein
MSPTFLQMLPYLYLKNNYITHWSIFACSFRQHISDVRHNLKILCHCKLKFPPPKKIVIRKFVDVFATHLKYFVKMTNKLLTYNQNILCNSPFHK